MFDNLMKFRKVSKIILTNYDKFVQFIKIQAEGSFEKIKGGNFNKNLRETLKNVGNIFRKFL